MMSAQVSFDRAPGVREDPEPSMSHEAVEVEKSLRNKVSRSVEISVQDSSLVEAEERIPLWGDPSQLFPQRVFCSCIYNVRCPCSLLSLAKAPKK